METPIIFIDIDGPLAWATPDLGRVKIAEGTWNEFTIPYPWEKEDCIALAKIVRKTKANLVVSSDWKLHYGLGQLKLIFEHYKISKWYVVDTTPSFNSINRLSKSFEMNRAHQIQSWIKAFKPKYWISIDDMALNLNYKILGMQQWRHVQVDGDFGRGGRLRDKIDECVAKLKSQNFANYKQQLNKGE